MPLDPYKDWLGLTAGKPANHYALLGLPLFTDDRQQIHAAAMDRMDRVRKYQLNHTADAVRVLSELGDAFACLHNPELKRNYDAALRGGSTLAERQPTTIDEPALAEILSTPDAADGYPATESVAAPAAPPIVIGADVVWPRRPVKIAATNMQPQVVPASAIPGTESGPHTHPGHGVWGLEVGASSLKALRCRLDETDRVLADAAVYLEYPQSLDEPDSDPEQLVQDALAQFTARHSLQGDRLALAVPGQSVLWRMIQLPPLERRHMLPIITHEAKQSIPFALDEVIWQWHEFPGAELSDGFVLDAVIGLSAIKRDQLSRRTDALRRAKVPVDFVQSAPLALHNFATVELFKSPVVERYDPLHPQESTVILSLGNECSDLVVTNGVRVWQRTIHLGGRHFTKALSKDLKLTFRKAEQLKRNAAQAENPKAVFQAMRPVFNDLLTEVQRSLGYFANLDRAAKISHLFVLGGPIKLPGLQRYLQQQLGLDVKHPTSFNTLTVAGPDVPPTLAQHVASFGVCYGLALQALGRAPIRTNLLPLDMQRGAAARLQTMLMKARRLLSRR